MKFNKNGALVFNKNGALGEQTIGLAYILLLLFLGIGIVSGVFLFYGKDIDSREVEGKLLANKVKDCILKEKIEWKEVEKNNKKFYDLCKLNEKAMNEYFILGINIDSKRELSLKDVVSCDFEGSKDNLYYPRCAKIFFEFEGKKYEIIAGSIQQIRRLVG